MENARDKERKFTLKVPRKEQLVVEIHFDVCNIIIHGLLFPGYFRGKVSFHCN